ncbi:MAG: pyridine nucleotide-disulfide oxidoreductase, partial [Planctomycetaceae bacterium]
LAKEAGLTLGPTGGIAVDAHMRTSDASIFAAGDAVEVVDFITGQAALVPLAGPANRQGRIAADNIFGRDSVYRKTQGTAICKVFDIAVGLTGLSEKALKRNAKRYEKIYIHPSSHASYYPGATPLNIKLLFESDSGKIFGAQAVGANGVDKFIDVLATAIRGGMTVFDLEDMELSYAPPYGSAKDPVNYAGFTAGNVLRGDVRVCHVQDVLGRTDAQVVLDVRTPDETAAGTIDGAINIPLDDLRARLGELPKDKELLVYCQAGLRGYIACRILSQSGFKCRNISGGYKTYRAFMDAASRAKQTVTPKKQVEKVMSQNSVSSAAVASAVSPTRCVDATGLQCPGPIMKLRNEVEQLSPGQSLTLTASDPGFAADAKAWCHSTGNELVSLVCKDGKYLATVKKSSGANVAAASCAAGGDDLTKGKTIVVFSNDFDKAMAAFIIANGAAAMGSSVTMFFTFWGLNVLRRPAAVPVKKNIVEKMFGWMMPRGAGKLKLSHMNMGGVGLAMIKGIMKKKNVSTLEELIASARAAGVKFVACTMSMDLMGIKREELIDGVEEGGVAMYLNQAQRGTVNLFI